MKFAETTGTLKFLESPKDIAMPKFGMEFFVKDVVCTGKDCPLCLNRK